MTDGITSNIQHVLYLINDLQWFNESNSDESDQCKTTVTSVVLRATNQRVVIIHYQNIYMNASMSYACTLIWLNNDLLSYYFQYINHGNYYENGNVASLIYRMYTVILVYVIIYIYLKYTHIYIYVCVCVCVCIYIYINIYCQFESKHYSSDSHWVKSISLALA